MILLFCQNETVLVSDDNDDIGRLMIVSCIMTIVVMLLMVVYSHEVCLCTWRAGTKPHGVTSQA